MLVSNTTDSIQIVLGANTTNSVHVYASYTQISTTGLTPSDTVTTITGTSAVSIVPSPSSGTQNQLRYCNVFNADVTSSSVTIRINYNGTIRNVINVVLQVNEYLQYTYKTGWKVFDMNGSLKVIDNNNNNLDLQYPEFIQTANFTTNSTLVGATSYCHYVGKSTGAPKSITIASTYAVAALAGTGAWGEIAVYKGTPTLGQNTTLNRCGFVDLSSFWTRGVTNYAAVVPVSNIMAGDDLWVVFACSGTTNLTARVSGLPDDIGAGFFQTIALTRPSQTASFTPTIDSTSTAIIRFAYSLI